MSVDKPQGLFVTGTDTGVGKTLVSSALSLFLRERGIDVGVMKPAETGIDDTSQLGPDAQLLQWASCSTDPAEQICPYRFKAPLAPAVAASKEQVRINYSDLLDAARALIERHQFTIIEGAGGLMVPLAGGLLMADLARDLKLPLLVVTRSNLGTINHTLLTLFTARTMELPVAGYLINRMPAVPGLAEETAPHSLASLTTEDLLGVLTQVEGNDREKSKVLAKEFAALPTLPLLKQHLPL
ncbi:MAG TPA: dethiobiotin synthase [Geopsychrobacteraceae bacterium]|nr:dethiobiotin synthase [Geopsychrobacteraceae bacterium]